MNYYNEHDPKAAAWLRELIRRELIPNGVVDERSITEVAARDLRGYTQCHFFAGIGGWSLALQLAGWPDSRPVGTGSCPCQPFSTAGKGLAQEDERHLWPVFFALICACRDDGQPWANTVFGEQVASAIGHGWLDGVSADLEAEGYACGAVVLGAHSVNAPHQRQRLYWAASYQATGWQRVVYATGCDEEGNCPKCGIDFADCGCFGPTQDGVEYDERDGILYARWLGNGIDQGPQGHLKPGNVELHTGTQQNGSTGTAGVSSRLVLPDSDGCGQGGSSAASAGHGHSVDSAGFWSDFRLAHCRDGKTRRIPTESAFFPLAHGVSARVVRLRGYGNAIVPQVAAEFIQAYQEITQSAAK